MPNTNTVFPIALDLGAKTTGVYAAGYKADTHIDKFASDDVFTTAFVACVDDTDKGYKLLQTDRTATRHGRRCRTRNRQAKKLLALVLEQSYGFPVQKHTVAISHFMNRRGYTYIENSVDSEFVNAIERELLEQVLHQLPESVHQEVFESFCEVKPFDALQVLAQDSSKLLLIKDAALIWIGSDKKKKKTLKPFTDAVDFFIAEKESGAKHRKDYFKAIKKDIDSLRHHPERSCRRFFHALNDSKKKTGRDMREVFYRLLCHINNFDLKLLNGIFSDLNESKRADSLETVIAKRFGKWICKQWQLSSSNGSQRLAEIRALRESWKQYTQEQPNSVFQFLLETAPERTIPPYESHTNRRPPSCQTLTFNAEYLDKTYDAWQQWLSVLESEPGCHLLTEYFRDQLGSVTSSKGNKLVETTEQNVRTLQFILDRSREQDSFKLNAIWSQWKKQRQLQREGRSTKTVDEALAQLCADSALPTELCFPLDKEPVPGSFWHLVNHYYQHRRRAKEGRYFLHYDNSKPRLSRWQRDGRLVVMCQHRPQQLKHQSSRDICVLLGLKQQQLDGAMAQNESVEAGVLFGQVKGLKTACYESYKAQKAHGQELKAALTVDPSLIKLSEKIVTHVRNVAVLLGVEDASVERFCERNGSAFIFAQLYQLVWGDRSGFGKTCPVCATDNAARMAGYNGLPQASRLHTLSMRLIDGGLKRLLNHQAHHIANRLWPEIERVGKVSGKVSVPIIIEQNRFDFTENLPKLKGVSGLKIKPIQNSPVLEKKERIKAASRGHCPYLKGEALTEQNGDIDHIIPRSGRYGVLNDEANLIYASTNGNRTIKKNRELTLFDLSSTYLHQQFGTDNVSAIERMIVERLQSDVEGQFSFGRYSQFVALNHDNQVAFRHALFLAPEHPLRQQVINAIQHRNKSRVNGTQRYMAQLLADILTQKAKKTALAGRLAFDYFEVSSNGQDENSTVALRRLMRDLTEGKENALSAFDKAPGAQQQAYSHVVDATMAFMLALDKHHGEGSLRIALNKDDSVWGMIDEEGVLTERLFSLVAVPQVQLAVPVLVQPQSSASKAQQVLSGVKPHQAYSRQIFKQNSIGLSFYDLALIEGKLFKGFVEEVDGEKQFIKAHEKEIDKKLDAFNYAVENGYYRSSQCANATLYCANKSRLMEALFQVLSQAKHSNTFNKKADDTVFVAWLFGKNAGSLYYYTTSSALELAPSIVEKQPNSPFKRQWLRHYESWLQIQPNTKVDKGSWVIPPEHHAEWVNHCKQVLDSGTSEKPEQYKPCHKAHRNFTMRSLTTSSGALAIVRRQRDGKAIYQLQAINTNEVPKEHSAALALASTHLVLFNKQVLSRGYQSNVEERKQIEGETLTVDQFLDKEACKSKSLNTDQLQIVIQTATTVEIKGICKNWFAQHLVLAGDNDEKRWHRLKSMKIANDAQGEDVLHQEKIKSLLKQACRNDKSAKVTVSDKHIGLILPYRTPALKKLIE
ncbi:hypothetical protein [Vibrio alfacsensis]|uniref:hypothetical protein n=1 Tax=Vibrio alfacsensis TaxID=1074311 RepID=UPI004067F184